MIRITQNKETRLVTAFVPYDEAFNARARQLGGLFSRFTDGIVGWRFPDDIKDDVAGAIEATFDVEPHYESDVLATVRLRFPKGRSAARAPIILCGHEIASARGRDSGARPGEGVSVVAGKIGSGGSVANWTTTLSAGAEVVIRNFPIKYLEAFKGADDVEIVEVVERAATQEGGGSIPVDIQAAIALLESHGYAVTKGE